MGRLDSANLAPRSTRLQAAVSFPLAPCLVTRIPWREGVGETATGVPILVSSFLWKRSLVMNMFRRWIGEGALEGQKWWNGTKEIYFLVLYGLGSPVMAVFLHRKSREPGGCSAHEAGCLSSPNLVLRA